MQLHLKSPGDAPGVYPMVRRGGELKHLSFTIVELGPGFEQHVFETGLEEVALSFYKGAVTVEVGSWSTRIPARASLAEPGPVVYIPPASTVRLAAEGAPVRIAVSGTPAAPGGSVALISPPDIMSVETGRDNFRRMVYTHIADNFSRAVDRRRTVSPDGWTSCPPHKHDRFKGLEVPMEKFTVPTSTRRKASVYPRHRQGRPFDHAFAVEHSDRDHPGYHPVSPTPATG
jgi:5-deoxy-D-glucuronate isomerase